MIGIYARQSIDKKDSISIESQIDFCKRECLPNDQVIIYKDKGFSGKNIKRPQFEKMLDDVQNGKLTKIVVYRLDRFSRSINDFSQIWSKLEEKHVEFISVNEKFDTSSPMGKAMLYIIMVFAQLERETIAERVRDNYYQRVKAGSWPGGPAPYGYKNTSFINENGKCERTLEIDEAMEVVKSIFNDYANGESSLGSIAKRLTEEKIECANRKSWDNVALSRILHNPVYTKADDNIYFYYQGKGVKIAQSIQEFDGSNAAYVVGKRTASSRKYTDLKDHVLSLANFKGSIDSNVWLQCQYKLERNSQIKNTGSGKNSWLSGYIKCGKCGYAISIKKGHKMREDKRYLACSGRTNLHICDVSGFEMDLEELESTVSTELKIALAECNKESFEMSELKSETNAKEQIIEIERKIQNLINAIAVSSDVTVSFINKEIEKLNHEKQQLLDNNVREESIDVRKYRNIDFDRLSFDEKKLVLKSFIEKILVYNDEIEIVWKV